MKFLKETKNFLIGFLETFQLKNTKSIIFNKIKKTKTREYQNQIIEIMNGERNLFVLNLEDLELNNVFKIKNFIYSNPLRFLKVLNEAINKIIQKKWKRSFKNWEKINNLKKKKEKIIKNFFEGYSLFEKKEPEYQIVIKPPSWMKFSPLNLLGANLIGKIVLVKGWVVEKNGYFYLIEKAIYECFNCGLKIPKGKISKNLKMFFYCPTKKCQFGKTKGRLFLNTNESVFSGFQEIKIQQKLENKDLENSFLTLNVRLFGTFSKSSVLGGKIKVGGVLLPNLKTTRIQKTICEEFYLHAFFIERITFLTKQKETKKKKELVKIFKDPKVYSRVSFSIAPSIYGFEDVKKATVLSLLSSNSSKESCFSRVGDCFNFFFTSGSGTGKSSFLRKISELGNPGILVNSSFFFKKVLWGLKSKFSYYKKGTKEINPFPIKGLLCVDEVFHYQKNQISVLLEILESNNVYQNHPNFLKGNSKEFNIIATTSFTELFFYSSREGIQLKKFFLNFDLCFLPENFSNFQFDFNLASHITSLFQKGEIETTFKIIKKETLKNFFLEAGKIFPFFPKSLFDLIIYNYLLLRSQNSENFEKGFSMRILFPIFRLSRALARLKFHRIVSYWDIQEACRLIGTSIKSLEVLKRKDFSQNQVNLRKKIYYLIRNFSIQEEKLSIDLLNLEILIFSKGFSRQSLVNCLRFYEDLNVWKVNVSRGELLFLI